MDFIEYREKIFDPTPPTPGMDYHFAIIWLNPERLPQALISLGGVDDSVIKIPEFYRHISQREVPIISFAKVVFAGNEKITDIILSRFIGNIPRNAFAGCKNLKRLTIPKRVRCIPKGAFQGCDSLEDVYYEGSEEEWGEVDIAHKTWRVKNPEQLGLYQEIEELAVPGNEALLGAHIHFNCNLNYKNETVKTPADFVIKLGKDDITDFFKFRF